jgi:hypothetical protein
MKRSPTSEERELTPAPAPKPEKATPRILHIEELEPRLTPQSVTPILE